MSSSSSSSSTSSFALVAFTSFLTLLISHLAVRQSPQVIHQPISQLNPQPAPVAAREPSPPLQPLPPPPTPPVQAPPAAFLAPPTVLISSNGAQVLYILVILVLLFGFSGLWLESQRPHGRCSTKNPRQKKKGYVSSSDSEDEDFPGSWRYKESRRRDEAREEERPKTQCKTWTGKVKDTVRDWDDSIKMKTMSGILKGKQKAQSGDEDDLKGNAQAKAACCGCCRILLEDCRKLEEGRRKEEMARLQQKEAESDKASEQAWALQRSSEGNNQASSSETRSTMQTRSSALPSASTSSFATTSKEEQETPGKTKQTNPSNGKGKAKEVAEETPVQTDGELIAEAPEPMPERAGITVEPLTDDNAVASALPVKEKAELDKAASSKKDKSSSSVISTGGKQDEGRIEETVKPTPVETQKDENDLGSPSAEPIEAKGEGKLKQGLHFITDVTKDITEEVLKQVLAHFDERRSDSQGKGTTAEENVQQNAPRDNAGKTSDSSIGQKKDEKETAKKDVEKHKPQEADKGKDNETSAVESSKSVEQLNMAIEAETESREGQVRSDSQATQDKEPQRDGIEVKGAKGQVDRMGSGVPAANTMPNEKDEGNRKGKGKDTDAAKVQSPAIDLNNCEPLVQSAIGALLEAFQTQNNGKDLYYKSADYLACAYADIVRESSGQVMKSLDEDFVSASNTQDAKIKIPWYSHKDGTPNTEPHQDGTEAETVKKVEKKAVAASETKSDKEDREAIMRALDLWHVYKEECEKDKVTTKEEAGITAGTSEMTKQSKTEADADGKLQNIIESLLKGQLEWEHDKGASIKEWTDQVAVEAKKSDGPSCSPCGYPNVIPLDAVTASSLAKAGVFSKHQRQVEKQSRRSETLKTAASEARKNMAQIKDDLLKEGATATSKAKVLKSLLKKKATGAEESSGGGTEKRTQSKSPRKSVRLQDAAGRGEGPRDVSRGETEQEARYRRLREMASRLND